EAKLRIGDEWREAVGGQYFECRSPLSGEAVTRAPAATVADAIAAADCAAQAFSEWSETGPNKRRALLARAAELLAERADTFIERILAETGTSTAWARFNVQGSVNALREAAAMTT